MTIAVSSILSRAATRLFEETAVRWPSAELLVWVQDGLAEMSLMKPTLFVEKKTLLLSGSVVQTLPDGTRHIHRIINNTGGKAIRVIALSLLEAQDPNWAARPATADVKYVMIDDGDPKTFLCSPPNDGNGSIDALCTVEPPQIAADGTISLDSPYANPLVSYVLYRAYMKDSDVGDAAEADKHYATFARQMGASVVGDAQAVGEQ